MLTKPRTFEQSYTTFKLTSTRLAEMEGKKIYRYVLLKDLNKNLPAPGVNIGYISNLLWSKDYSSKGFYSAAIRLALTKGGSLRIGCKTFSPENSDMILRAAGVPKAKRRSQVTTKKRTTKRTRR